MTNDGQLYENGLQVNTLYCCIRDSANLELIPLIVKRVIGDGMWQKHLFEKTGEVFTVDTFQTFVEIHPPDGLGTTIDILKKLCRDDNEALDAIDEAMMRDKGGQAGNKNASKEETNASSRSIRFETKCPAGTTRQYGLRRLRKAAESSQEIAQLRDLVLAGEMSVNKAMVKAGFRRKTFTVAEDVGSVVRALRKRFASYDLVEIAKGILEEEDNETLA